MDRKSVYLWPDQVRALEEMSWRIRREHRGSGGDVVRASTLIRIAVDMFLDTAFPGDALLISASTENGLRRAVGLRERNTDGHPAGHFAGHFADQGGRADSASRMNDAKPTTGSALPAQHGVRPDDESRARAVPPRRSRKRRV